MNQNTKEFTPQSPSSPPPTSNQDAEPAERKEHGEREPNSKVDFETMVEFYLASNPYVRGAKGANSELEVRFGTNPKSTRPISKIDYDNVIKSFQSAGFTTPNPDGLSILRIQNEYFNAKRGETIVSNIRAEVTGLDLIQEYCRTNNLQKLIDLPSTSSARSDKIKFTQKMPPIITGRTEGKPLKPVEFPDFNFRVSYQMEKDFTVRSDIAKNIISSWNDSKKLFRYINRVRFSHPDYPVFLDISIVKGSSKTDRKVPIPQYTVQEAKVFQNPESYEIELELDNSRVGPGTPFAKIGPLMEAIRKCIRFVLSGLQGTSYPIAYSEKDKVLQMYFDTVFGKEYAENYMRNYLSSNDKERFKARRILTRHFIGPSSYTLQLENIQPVSEGENVSNRSVPNIRTHYSVTDKADGERKLLYVASNGRIYMIDTNMNVIFTGAASREKELYNSVLDGEHIKYDKTGKFVNLYAAFDIYYIAGKSKRELGFIPASSEDAESNFRLPLLSVFISKLKPISILDFTGGNSDAEEKHKPSSNEKQATSGKHACEFTVRCKDFYTDDTNTSIFGACASILSKVRDGTYEYNTDGLIFTPTNTGVGGDRIGSAGPLKKYTWPQSFKWKPASFNTIDFLVSVKKDKTGKDEVHHVFQEGVNLAATQNIVQYKVIELRCGFNQKEHGYINPMLNLINDDLPTVGDKENDKYYQPVIFQPTNPFDSKAHLCNVMLHDNGNGGLTMLTEEHEYFEEDMIVEFSYNPLKSGGWKWTPLRVRYDKTNDLRSGGNNFGNAYHVANSNWQSIHNPVTDVMITTGQDIPEITTDTDVYYNRTGKETNTRPLRDFHNYMKRKLIVGASTRGQTLIDYAVGKGGDLSKWIDAKLDFVFGIDISKDNIENHLDGACARYLNYRAKYRDMPGALFVNGNSGSNIRSGKAMFSEKDKQISQAVFGKGPKDRSELGEGVYKRYGVGEPGFHISSCQFAFHYFFESPRTMHQFMRNLAECTRIQGYFIGTCYDGQTVFNLLRNKHKGESVTIMREDVKIYEITKQYDQTGFPEDELSLGYAVDIYQESINKTAREFLVNFKYVLQVMENYGFALITSEEAKGMGFINGSALFDECFHRLVAHADRNKRNSSDFGEALNMTTEEKRISFLNRYFIFRKMRNVNAEKIGKLMMNRPENEGEDEDAEDREKHERALENAVLDKKSVIRKISGAKVQIVIGSSQPEGTVSYGKSVTIKRPKK
jgi:hypothetical protein